MAFCSECGAKLDNNDRFCSNCGAMVEIDPADWEPPRNPAHRTQEYAGKIIKCPQCGETLGSFVTFCPSCGCEIRGAANSSAVEDFSRQIRMAYNDREKIAIIRNFPIPNTKEDILEFAILASTNINENLNLDDEVSDAWFAKLGQADQKAHVTFPDQPECDRVRTLYDHVKTEIESAKKSNAVSRQKSALSNIIVVTGWLLAIFILIPLCREDFNDTLAYTMFMLLLAVLILGAFLIPGTCRCDSAAPKMITAIGLVISIILTIPFIIISDIYMYLMVIIIDIIFSAIILARIFRRDSSPQMDSYSLRTTGICIAMCLAVYFIIWAVVAVNLR